MIKIFVNVGKIKFHIKLNVFWILFVLILLLIIFPFFNPYDDTDDIVNKKRSGLILYVDYKTGVEYVGTTRGGLCPRVDMDGNIIIKESEKIKRIEGGR